MRRGVVQGLACGALLGAACPQAIGEVTGAAETSILGTQPASPLLLGGVLLFAIMIVVKSRA